MLHQDVIVELLSVLSHRRQSHAGIRESQLQRVVNDGLNCGDGVCTKTASSDDAAEGQGAGRFLFPSECPDLPRARALRFAM
jgi:hypothetical protein